MYIYKKIFFVIPENILIEGFIGNNSEKKQKYFKVEIKETLTKKNKWLQTYMFNYENIDKIRLLNLLNLEMSLEMSLETSLEISLEKSLENLKI
jgi:hypothetical protein